VLQSLSALQRLELFHDCPTHLDNQGDEQHKGGENDLDPDEKAEVCLGTRCVLKRGGCSIIFKQSGCQLRRQGWGSYSTQLAQCKWSAIFGDGQHEASGENDLDPDKKEEVCLCIWAEGRGGLKTA
jgi:hypothetical protein